MIISKARNKSNRFEVHFANIKIYVTREKVLEINFHTPKILRFSVSTADISIYECWNENFIIIIDLKKIDHFRKATD